MARRRKKILLIGSHEVFAYGLVVIKDQLVADPNRWPEGKNDCSYLKYNFRDDKFPQEFY